MALNVENVVDRGMHPKKVPCRADALEALHLALPLSGRLMRVLGPIVLPSSAFVSVLESQVAGRGAV